VGGFLAKSKKLKREQVKGQEGTHSKGKSQVRIRNCNEKRIALSKKSRKRKKRGRASEMWCA